MLALFIRLLDATTSFLSRVLPVSGFTLQVQVDCLAGVDHGESYVGPAWNAHSSKPFVLSVHNG